MHLSKIIAFFAGILLVGLESATIPTTCSQLKANGATVSGLYQIQGTSAFSGRLRVDTVFCDFTKVAGTAGFQTFIGYNDVKTSPVYFDVGRTCGYNKGLTIMPFDVQRTNIGGAMNLTSGIFTAPRPGIYSFSFSARSEGTASSFPTAMDLVVNRVRVGDSICTGVDQSCSFEDTLLLKKSDQVAIFLRSGGIVDDSFGYTHFSGVLIEENIFE